MCVACHRMLVDHYHFCFIVLYTAFICPALNGLSCDMNGMLASQALTLVVLGLCTWSIFARMTVFKAMVWSVEPCIEQWNMSKKSSLSKTSQLNFGEKKNSLIMHMERHKLISGKAASVAPKWFPGHMFESRPRFPQSDGGLLRRRRCNRYFGCTSKDPRHGRN